LLVQSASTDAAALQLERESWELREAEFHQQQLEWKHEEVPSLLASLAQKYKY
jgi:hypothetical protein